MKSIYEEGGNLLINLRDAANYMIVIPLTQMICLWLVFEINKCTSSEQVSL